MCWTASFDSSCGPGFTRRLERIGPGRSPFQGHRHIVALTAPESAVLERIAADLPSDPGVATLDERLLEQLHFRNVAGDTLPAELDPVYRRVLERIVPRRDATLACAARARLGGGCQIAGCGFASFRELDLAIDLTEAHHVRYLARGGRDAPGNICVLCPDHHRLVHRVDAPFDYAEQAFVVGEHRLALRADAPAILPDDR